MHAVGQAAGPWLPLHEVVKTVLSELGERKALQQPPAQDCTGSARGKLKQDWRFSSRE